MPRHPVLSPAPAPAPARLGVSVGARVGVGTALVGGLLAAMVLGACAKPAPASTLQPAASDTVQDQGATFKVQVSWQPKSADEIELVVEMVSAGIEQTDNLVVDVKTHGFVITEGVPDWTGFVLPRERYTHRVSYKMLDDEDQGRATVTIRRTLDSTLLWDTELLFGRDGGSVRLAG